MIETISVWFGAVSVWNLAPWSLFGKWCLRLGVSTAHPQGLICEMP